MAFGHVDDKQQDEFYLYLTKGDTAPFAVVIDGYEVQDGDTLTFSLVDELGKEPILTKTIPANQAFILSPEETDLEVGTYYYDVQLDTATGMRFTVITPAKFEITEEVTLNGNS